MLRDATSTELIQTNLISNDTTNKGGNLSVGLIRGGCGVLSLWNGNVHGR
eukprot:m.300991 g.300991  ORF g.300991 m.300991 type:complete len:50 (+) comp297419_c0_seq1:6-155(+)